MGILQAGGRQPTIWGFLGGAIVFCVANWLLAKAAVKHRNAAAVASSKDRKG